MKKYVYVCIIAGLISGRTNAAPVQWSKISGGNNHYYEVIQVIEGINWISAKNAAENMTYLGVQGHLVTITSEGEETFVASAMNGIIDTGLAGGYQPSGSPEPDGNWQWITGTGEPWEPWVYSNWYYLEPNNNGDENVLQITSLDHIYWPTKWNDIPMDKIQPGYVVEYTPEPATLLLLTLGGFILRRKK